MYRTVSILILSLLSLSLSTIPAYAEDGQQDVTGSLPQRPPMGMSVHFEGATLGTVSAVSGTTLTISTRGESMSVDASSATIVRVPDTSITVADIAVGDTVLVQGEKSDAGISAMRIMVGVPTQARPQMQRPEDQNSNDQNDQENQGDRNDRAQGPMMPLGASSTSQQRGERPEGMMGERGRTEDGTTSTSTNRGLHLGWLQGIGNLIFHRGDTKRSEQGTSDGRSNAAFGIGGRVASVDGTSFTLEMPAHGQDATSTATVTTDASTIFMQIGVGSTTIDAVTVGSFASVRGTMTSTSTHTIAATRVEIASTSPAMRGPSQEDMQQLRDHEQSIGEGDQGTSTPVRKFFQNFMQRLGGFFHF